MAAEVALFLTMITVTRSAWKLPRTTQNTLAADFPSNCIEKMMLNYIWQLSLETLMWVLKRKILMGTSIPRNTTRQWRYFQIQSNDIITIFFQFTKKVLFIFCRVYVCMYVLKLVIFKFVRVEQWCNSIFSASYTFGNHSFSFIVYLGSFQSRVLWWRRRGETTIWRWRLWWWNRSVWGPTGCFK